MGSLGKKWLRSTQRLGQKHPKEQEFLPPYPLLPKLNFLTEKMWGGVQEDKHWWIPKSGVPHTTFWGSLPGPQTCDLSVIEIMIILITIIMMITIAHIYEALDMYQFTVLSPVYLLIHFILTTTLQGRYYCYSCFTHKATEMQSSLVTWWRSHSE